MKRDHFVFAEGGLAQSFAAPSVLRRGLQSDQLPVDDAPGLLAHVVRVYFTLLVDRRQDLNHALQTVCGGSHDSRTRAH